MAKLLVEMVLELEVPDNVTSYELAVKRFFQKAAKVPFGMLLQKLSIQGIRKIEPWEESLPRF